MAINEDLDLWLEDRARSARILQFANYRYASRLNQWNVYSGMAIAVLTTAAGTTALTELSSTGGAYAVASLSALAAVITAARTAAKWGDLAAQHRQSAHTYGALRFEIERIRAAHRVDEETAAAFAEDVSKRMSEADAACPELPERWYVKGEDHVQRPNQSVFATAA